MRFIGMLKQLRFERHNHLEIERGKVRVRVDCVDILMRKQYFVRNDFRFDSHLILK